MLLSKNLNEEQLRKASNLTPVNLPLFNWSITIRVSVLSLFNWKDLGGKGRNVIVAVGLSAYMPIMST